LQGIMRLLNGLNKACEIHSAITACNKIFMLYQSVNSFSNG
jgi:hypothetical protein